MIYRYPNYYQRFSCIADQCDSTCCAGWEIVVDEDSIEKYLQVKSDFGHCLCNSIDFVEGIFHQDSRKRCVFLKEDNLCDIYSQLGEAYLCYTCTQYPRHIEEFEAANEVSLSISCPEVASLILNCEEKVSFYEEDIEEDTEEYEEFDYLFYDILVDVRSIIFSLLQNRAFPIRDRMKLTIQLCYKVQGKINASEIFEVEEILATYQSMSIENISIENDESAINDEMTPYYIIQSIIQHLFQLEALNEEWQPNLLKNQKLLYTRDENEYLELRKYFEQTYRVELERMEEQLQIYFVYSYLCGAVYDGELLSKYLLAYVTTIIIEELWFAKYLEQGNKLSNKDMQRVVYAYAREIEHSDQNLEILENMYQEEKEYQEKYMMRL